MLNEQLLKQFDMELREDYSNFGSDFQTWSEVCLSMSSSEVYTLLEQIPEGQEPEYYDKIDEIINTIGHDVFVSERCDRLYTELTDAIDSFRDDLDEQRSSLGQGELSNEEFVDKVNNVLNNLREDFA